MKNTSDRFKLILQLLVFTPGLFLFLLLLIMFSGVLQFAQETQFGLVLSLLISVSIIVNLLIFAIRWRRLRIEEDAGITPDYENQNNIRPRQLPFLCLMIILALGVTVFSQIYLHQSGAAICSGLGMLLIAVGSAYKKIKGENPNTPKGQ